MKDRHNSRTLAPSLSLASEAQSLPGGGTTVMGFPIREDPAGSLFSFVQRTTPNPLSFSRHLTFELFAVLIHCRAAGCDDNQLSTGLFDCGWLFWLFAAPAVAQNTTMSDHQCSWVHLQFKPGRSQGEGGQVSSGRAEEGFSLGG